MGAPYPRLYGGLGTTQGIWDTTTTAVVPVGTRGSLEDGRVFYYARSSGAAITAGQLLESERVSVDMDDLATNTAALGDTSVAVTPVGTAVFTANALQGGYLVTNSGTTGAGKTYRIASNPETTAATAFTVQLTDPIAEAFHADTTVTVVKNPWMDTVISATTQTKMVAGISNVDVALGSTDPQYFWCQTWGMCSGWMDEAVAAGAAIVSGTGVAGQIEAGDLVGEQVIGVNIFTGVIADYGPVFLQIAP